MKKFYSFLVAAVLLMGATSCQKEATADAGAADNVEFVASIAGGRTELAGNKVMWNANDNIRIFTQENFAGTEFNSDATAATATAKFTTTQSFTPSNNGYLAVYPESANKTDNGFSSTVHNASYAEGVWSIPVNMQGCDNFNYPFTFEKNSFMAAFSNDNQLSFKAATAMLKIKNVKNAGWGSVAFTGANLCGEATLHYDTNNAENPISYTLGSGDSKLDYNFSDAGETIYVPIYPGTVTGFTVYSGNDVLVEYTKTITFKAGVIYDLDLDNAPIGGGDEGDDNVSPWKLFDYNTGNEFQMSIDENGYHVAKNVPFSEGGYYLMKDWMNLMQVSGEIQLNTWMELSEGMDNMLTIPTDYADIYMTEDCSMLCIVPAGENLPALLQIKVYNKFGWSKVNCYAWDPSVSGDNWLTAWPGTTMEKDGDWYVYTLDEKYRGKNLSFIFNDGTNKTLNLEFVYMDDTRHFRVDAASTAVAITPENKEAKPGVTIYVKNSANWNPLKIYSWNDSGQPQSASWSGTQMTQTEVINGVTYYKYAFNNYDNTKGLHVILNNGSQQTNDIDVGKFGEPMFINVKGDRSHEVIADPRN